MKLDSSLNTETNCTLKETSFSIKSSFLSSLAKINIPKSQIKRRTYWEGNPLCIRDCINISPINRSYSTKCPISSIFEYCFQINSTFIFLFLRINFVNQPIISQINNAESFYIHCIFSLFSFIISKKGAIRSYFSIFCFKSLNHFIGVRSLSCCIYFYISSSKITS